VPPAFGEHRHSGRRECLDVAEHGAGRDLEFVRERGCRKPAALAQQQHEGDQPIRAHPITVPKYMTQDVVNRCEARNERESTGPRSARWLARTHRMEQQWQWNERQ
jgi:hypothetical protein